MNFEKAEFLKNEFVQHLRQIPPGQQPLWGKMNLQQMIEHFIDAVRVASGRIAVTDIITPADKIEKMQAFLMSDKPFKENTPNPLLPDVPAPVNNLNVNEAIAELQQEIDFFFSVFEEDHQRITRNPFFGDLYFKENVQLLHKHALHHLRQFGVIV